MVGNQIVQHEYARTDGPDKNPLKGWNSGWWNDFPEASVGFQYISWKAFEPQEGTFDFNAVETIIDRPGSRGRHLILRLYCDWDGKEDTPPCPDWLYSKGVARLTDDNGRHVTDFNNPTYVAEAQKAIEALAAHYDDDPRAYAFELGILGYWGEWHTAGSSFSGQSYPISDAAKNAILLAYRNAFSRTAIMGRYPWREPLASVGWIGFHNDYFVVDNGHSADFDDAIAAGALWRNGPVGGEVPPRSIDEAPTERVALYATGKGLALVDKGHYSTMQPGAYRQVSGDPYFPAYMAMHRRMGYNFQIDRASFADRAILGHPFTATVAGHNIGVAPMYYDWDVEFALLDSSDRVVATAPAHNDLRDWLPGQAFTTEATFDTSSGFAQGDYRLAIRIVQPGAAAAKASPWKLDARNVYILFANALPVIDGHWDANHALVGGYSVLGQVKIAPA